MITAQMQKELNAHLKLELASAYIYLSMSADFQSKALMGFSNWMHYQAKEEVEHALKFYQYLHARGGKITLQSIEAPPAEWGTPMAAFEEAYAHEQKVTHAIHQLLESAQKEQDKATELFLHGFVSEQVEEEARVETIIQQLKHLKNSPEGIFLLDRELSKRTS